MAQNSSKTRKAVIICVWIILFIMILINRDKISIDKIVSFSPENAFLAAMIILALFTAKGGSGLINADILYTSCGV
ncbi:MAG: hypothetical protein IJ364_02805, partial [Oscillospiraceae bacterium]|nr:hypothetical protein [Oscillospiraceae bacterium]